MRAHVLTELKTPLQLQDVPDPQVEAESVVIKLKSAALNRRDYWITQGRYPGIVLPLVLGSDGVGEVIAAGTNAGLTPSSDEVIINPGWDWGDDEKAQSDHFTILGLPHPGTLAELIKVPARYVHPKPAHLDTAQAAALPLAGLTAWRGIFTRGKLQAGENVLVTGAGGGVATFAVQFAVAAGANVFVTSSSEEKIASAIKLGAKQGFNYRNTDWAKELARQVGPIDLTFDGAGGNGYNDLMEVAASGGRIVNYGGTNGAPEKCDIFRVYWKQLNLLGSTMGSEQDFAAMLKFVSDKQIMPAIDRIFDFQDANAAMQRMSECDQFGKLVIRV